MTTRSLSELLELENYDDLSDSEVRAIIDYKTDVAYKQGKSSGVQNTINNFLSNPLYEASIDRAVEAHNAFMAQVIKARKLEAETHG